MESHHCRYHHVCIGKKQFAGCIECSTGKEIWIHANLRGITGRGINYWESEDRKDRRLIFQINNYLEEINALTGKSILTFGNKGLVDLKQGMGRILKLFSESSQVHREQYLKT